MIMKTIDIFRYAAVLFAALTMSVMTSCEDPVDEPDDPNGSEEVEVVFPNPVENFQVKPGETLTLKFAPAKDWTVSVPSESIQWFWIADGAFKLDKISGNASSEEVTVTIGVSEVEEFDTNRSCDVTLQIGDESKVIAKYMRPAKERTMAVYVAEMSEDGDYLLAEDGVSYVYATEEAASVSLVWSPSMTDFRAPLRVESNGEWTISYPEWMTVNVPEKTAGVVELVLVGESLDAAEGKITFTSGDAEIKVIDVRIPSCRGLEVFSAVVSDGEFEYGEGGEYAWTDSPVSELSLAWLGSDFRMPVKVSSKCDWTVDLPEWLSVELPLETAGDKTMTLLGVPSKYPLEETSGKLVFRLGDAVLHEMKVTIPGCKDIISYSIDMALTELAFNSAGDVMTTTGYADIDVTGTVFGTSQTEIFACEYVGGRYVIDSEPDWINITVANFNTADGASVLQERKFTVTVTENKGDERSAILFFVPHYIWGKLSLAFTEDFSAVKEEFLQYVVNVSQLSDEFSITMASDEETMADAGATFTEASDEKKAELSAAFGETDKVYVLTYDNVYARDEARMTMSREFSSVRVFDNAYVDKSAETAFWLAFSHEEGVNDAGIVDMYFVPDSTDETVLPAVPSTGYVVFYDASGEVLAIVECVSPYEEEVVAPPVEGENDITDEYGNVYFENSSYFSDPDAASLAGAKLYELKSGIYYDQYKESDCPILLLEYPSVDTEVELVLPVKISFWYVMPYVFSDYIILNDETIYDTSGIMAGYTDKIRIRMSEKLASNKEEVETNTKDKPAGLKITLHKNFSTQDPEIVVFCRLKVSE